MTIVATVDGRNNEADCDRVSEEKNESFIRTHAKEDGIGVERGEVPLTKSDEESSTTNKCQA